MNDHPVRMDLPDTMSPTLAAQLGLVTREQLYEHGVSRATLRWALGRFWRMPLPGVVATFIGALTARQEVIAAALWAGEGAVLTGLNAARWHQLAPLTHWRPFWFLVEPTRAGRTTRGVRVTRTRRQEPRPWRRGVLTVASPSRALADAARELRYTAGVDALIIEAVQRGIVTADALRHEAEAGPCRWSARLRAALDIVDRNAWSFPEGLLLDARDGSSVLPGLWLNPVLTAADGVRLPTPDGWIDEVGLAIQVHSVLHHAMSKDWEGTLVDDGVYAEHGICMLPFTPARIRQDPAWVRARVEKAYSSLSGRPRLDVVARERSLLTVR